MIFSFLQKLSSKQIQDTYTIPSTKENFEFPYQKKETFILKSAQWQITHSTTTVIPTLFHFCF